MQRFPGNATTHCFGHRLRPHHPSWSWHGRDDTRRRFRYPKRIEFARGRTRRINISMVEGPLSLNGLAIGPKSFLVRSSAHRASTAPRRTCGRLRGFLPFHELWGVCRSRRLQVGGEVPLRSPVVWFWYHTRGCPVPRS
jgi:hypothetical protein